MAGLPRALSSSSSPNKGLQKKAISDYKEEELSPKSHVIIYGYTNTIARESVEDFFYPPIAVQKISSRSSNALPVGEMEKELRIRQMRRDVFLLAFEAIQKLPPTDMWSFFQIAGIHGLPNTLYDGARDDTRKDDDDYGYCQHGSPLFPTWHRPYVMLLEQSIIRHAQLLPFSDLDEKELVRNTIAGLRMPYWDWADHASRTMGVPDIFITSDINLLYPWKSFRRQTIPNPLKAFVSPLDVGTPIGSDIYNPSAKPNYMVPLDSTPYMPSGYPTVRHVSPSFTTQNDSLNLHFLRHVEQCLVGRVHDIFNIHNWNEFSNHSHSGSYGSVEGVHDHLHDIVGGCGGQMAYVDTAGFDPIFFFHHCNVDRLVALWQYCYPDAWIKPPNDSQHSDRIIDEYSLLTPFRCLPNIFLCSQDVLKVDEQCGYSYPELLQAKEERWEPEEMRKYVQECLYVPANLCKHRWFLVVEEVHKGAFNVPYQIRVFLNLPEADHTTSISSPNYAGYIAVFARSNDSKCSNCIANEMAMQGSVEVTAAMLRLGLVDLASAIELRPFPEEEALQNLEDPPNLRNEERISVKLVFVTLGGKLLDPSLVPCWSITGGPKHSIQYAGSLGNLSLSASLDAMETRKKKRVGPV